MDLEDAIVGICFVFLHSSGNTYNYIVELRRIP